MLSSVNSKLQPLNLYLIIHVYEFEFQKILNSYEFIQFEWFYKSFTNMRPRLGSWNYNCSTTIESICMDNEFDGLLIHFWVLKCCCVIEVNSNLNSAHCCQLKAIFKRQPLSNVLTCLSKNNFWNYARSIIISLDSDIPSDYPAKILCRWLMWSCQSLCISLVLAQVPSQAFTKYTQM